MKEKLLILLLALMATVTASAYDFTYDYYDFTYDYNGKTLRFITTSDNTCEVAKISKYIGDIVIPSVVTYNKTNYSVASIGSFSFALSENLTSVEIPNSVISIGGWAFQWCSGLTSVEIPNSVSLIGDCAFVSCKGMKAFYGKYASEDNRCLIVDGVLNSFAPSGLTSYTIPNSITSIGYGAFVNCEELTSIEIPNSVTSIGEEAFYRCNRLTSIEIPNSVTSIGEFAFRECTELKSVAIPNSVTSIENCAFNCCNKLTTVVIPNSITSMGDNIFSGCYRLTSFYGEYASEDNRCLIFDGVLNSFAPLGLTSYIIPNSVTTIGVNAFNGCSALESIVIPNSVTSIGDGAFFGCNKLESIEIPNSVTEIGASTFYNCKGLKSIVIPNSVTSIGANSFYDCKGLKSIEIPNSVTSIGTWAFFSCGLESIEIPNSVTSIGYRAFDDCRGLTSITINNDNPSNISLSDDVFNNIPTETCVLYVPKGSKELYAVADQWKDFANIEEVDFNTSSEPDSFTYEYQGKTLYFDVTSKNTCSISSPSFGYYSGDVVIPSTVTYNGTTYTVTEIRPVAFAQCFNLTSVVIPNSVTAIGGHAFWSCRGLTSIEIPSSVTSVGVCAFSDCTNLSAFYGKYASEDNRCLIVDGALMAFANIGLTEYSIPTSVTSIGDAVFQSCDKLTSIEIPNSVTSIGLATFGYCTGLTSVNIPESVNFIDEMAFLDCKELNTFIVHSDNPSNITLGRNVFPNNIKTTGTLIVPNGSRELYAAADQWKDFANIEELIWSESCSFSAEGVDAAAGKVALLPVTMTNEESIIGFQFDVVLPDGFSLAKDDNDLYYLGKSSRFVDHYVSSNEVDGAVRFIAVSLNNRAFRDNDGVLCYIPVIATGDPRQAEIEIRNIKLSDSNSTQIDVAPVTAAVNVLPPYILGDANDDGEISVADVTITISAVLGSVQPNFVKNAADIDANGEITVADVTSIITMVLNPAATHKAPAKAPTLVATANAPEVSINNVTIEKGGTATMEISLDNAEEYRDYQFNLTLPDAEFQIVKDSNDIYAIQSTDRTSTHGVSSSYLGDGEYKVVGASLSAITIKPGNGPIATVEITTDAEPGTYTYTISDIELSYVGSDGTTQRCHPAGSSATITVTEAEAIRYGDNQLYVKDIKINQGENATMNIGYNSTSDVYEYGASIVLPNGVSVSSFEFKPVVTDVANYSNTWSFDNSILSVNGVIGSNRKDKPVPSGDNIFAVAVLNTSALAAGEYTISVQSQSLSNDDDDYSPANYEAKLIVKGSAVTVSLVDGTPYTNDVDMECAVITYTRTYDNACWQALYLPFDMDYDDWAELGDIAKLNNVHQYDDDKDGVLDRTTLEFNRVKSGSITANTPYVFRPKATGEVVLSAHDATLHAAPATDQSVWCASTEKVYTIYGTYVAKEGLYAQEAYALSPLGQFVKAETPEQTLKPYRIYLLITDKSYGGSTQKSPARISISVDGETSGIDDIELIEPTDNIYYDLMGRPVVNPQPGIYIRNGEKVIIK